MAIIQAVGFFFGHGSGNYISRQLGAKEHRKAEKMASTGFILSFFAGLLIAIRDRFSSLRSPSSMGSTPTILPYTERYLGIVMLGAPFHDNVAHTEQSDAFSGQHNVGDEGHPVGSFAQSVLAPLLIIYFCMGITGAAIATLISQTFGCLMLFLMSRRGQNIRIRLKDFTPNKQIAKEIIFGGTPSLSRQGLGSVSTILLNVAAGAYGDAAIAGMSIVTRISFFTYAIVIGLGQGFQPLCGFCYGAHLYQRVKEAFYFCIKCGTVFLSVCALVGFVFSESIIGLFRSDPDVIHVGAAALQWQVLSFPLVSTIVLTNMLMQTIRKPIRANLVAAAEADFSSFRSSLYCLISLVCWAWKCVRLGQMHAALPWPFLSPGVLSGI